MKGKLLTVFFSLVILVGLSTSVFSQAVRIDFKDEPIDPTTGLQLAHGAAILIIEASQDTIDNGIKAPDVNNPFFVSNGDNLAHESASYYNPNSYFNFQDQYGIPFFPQSIATTLDASQYDEGQTYSFFVRIFNNLRGEGDPAGNFPSASFSSNGDYIGDAPALSSTFYFDTNIVSITIPPAPDVATALFEISAADQVWQPLIDSEPVPEPGAMFLMATGLLWFGRKLKRK